ncbi:hypothetical protein B0H13DRAFT_1916248 [Mycena leptocephala]|nr:hypothetical protein B0H13DRAFT_1916248 [Mycena leptocephala]
MSAHLSRLQESSYGSHSSKPWVTWRQASDWPQLAVTSQLLPSYLERSPLPKPGRFTMVDAQGCFTKLDMKALPHPTYTTPELSRMRAPFGTSVPVPRHHTPTTLTLAARNEDSRGIKAAPLVGFSAAENTQSTASSPNARLRLLPHMQGFCTVDVEIACMGSILRPGLCAHPSYIGDRGFGGLNVELESALCLRNKCRNARVRKNWGLSLILSSLAGCIQHCPQHAESVPSSTLLPPGSHAVRDVATMSTTPRACPCLLGFDPRLRQHSPRFKTENHIELIVLHLGVYAVAAKVWMSGSPRVAARDSILTSVLAVRI